MATPAGRTGPARGLLPLVMLVMLVMAGLLAGLAGGQAVAGEDKKRREPPSPAPVVAGGVRYEVAPHGQPFGYQQDGGILLARDAASGELQWSRRIYRITRDPAMEGDKQDIFIKQLDLSPDRRRLRIVNEHGQTFELGLDGGPPPALR